MRGKVAKKLRKASKKAADNLPEVSYQYKKYRVTYWENGEKMDMTRLTRVLGDCYRKLYKFSKKAYKGEASSQRNVESTSGIPL